MSATPQALDEFRKRVLYSFYLFIATLAIGTIGYRIIGGPAYSYMDCFYMTVITVATVGYREVVDITQNDVGKGFTIFLIFAGMSVILYFMSNITAMLIEGDIKEIFWRKKMKKIIEKTKDHYIVCGVGNIGWHVVQELYSTGRALVVVDGEPVKVDALKEAMPDVPIILGDATDTDVLVEAGIERATGIIVATGHDKDNLVITLSARQVSQNLRIITRCNEIKNADKLKKAGADSVVSSSLIGGLRMVSEMVRPAVVTFLDKMLRDKERNLRIEEIAIVEGSQLAGKKAHDLKKYALLLAILHSDGSYQYNPPDDLVLAPGHTLVLMASVEDRCKLESLIKK